MGRQTRYFRQSKKSLSGDRGAKNFAKISRNSGWRILNLFKKGEKI